MPDTIQGLIFDMGGVLLRTINNQPRKRMAARFGVSQKELESYIFMSEISLQSEIGELSDRDHWETVLHRFNQPERNFLQLYDEFFSGDAIDQELLAFLVSLKPDHKLGLLSNAWEGARYRIGAKFSFIDIFDVSIFSYEVGVRKPDVKIYTEMLERMRVKPKDAIFVDDMPVNIDGALSAGLHAIRYTNTPEVIGKLNELLNL